MKIAFALFKYFPFGGLEKDMLRMAITAVRRGYEVTIFTGSVSGDIPAEIEVVQLELKSWSNHGKAQEFVRRFAEQRKKRKFDAIIAFNRIPGCDFYFAADNCYAVEMPKKHCRWVLEHLSRYRTYLQLEREIFSPGVPCKIFYLAEKQKRDYQSIYHTEEDRFTLLPPGINPACRRTSDAEARRIAKRAELGVADDVKLMLLVGSNYHLKGVDRVLEAVAALPDKLREKSIFMIAGQSNDQWVRAMIKKLGIADNVRILGSRQDVPDLLLAADLLLHPARNEAAGTVLAEAISSGSPIICSGECGFSELVAASGGGVVPENFDQQIFSEMVKSFLENSDELRRKAIEYSAKVDYTHRAETALDVVEKSNA